MTQTLARTPRNPAAYLRQSKDDPDGITRQREATIALCERKGWPAPAIYEDDDRSASSGDPRPRYQDLLTDIRAGRIDGVVVAQLDRLHRRPIELEEFISSADEKRLAMACASGDVDLATDDGQFMARVIGAAARKEAQRLSWRLKQAAEQRAENGEQWWSVRPFGYTRQPILDQEGNVMVNPTAPRYGSRCRSRSRRRCYGTPTPLCWPKPQACTPSRRSGTTLASQPRVATSGAGARYARC